MIGKNETSWDESTEELLVPGLGQPWAGSWNPFRIESSARLPWVGLSNSVSVV